MEEQFLQQFKNINFGLGHLQDLIQNQSLNLKDLSFQLSQIKNSLEGINNNFITYQSKITNQPWFQFVIGSIVTLTATLVIEYFKNKKAKKAHLYYLERMIVDQINMIAEVKHTVISFLNEKISTLIKNIDNNPGSAYSVDTIFFPLFSIRSLPEEVNMKSSGSGYIDNKIGKIYALSKDLPHIFDDIRIQLRATLEINEKIVFGKSNSPEVQKEQYKRNIQELKKMLENGILETTIPLYFRKLTETLVAVREKASTNPFIWKIKFTPWWKFYTKKSDYFKAKSQIMEDMDLYFKPATEKQLEEINKF